MGRVKGRLNKRVILSRVLFGNEVPSLWKAFMKKSSCGINREGVLRGLRMSMVVFIGPYSCLFWRICRAYSEVGLLFLMDLVCSW